MASRTKRRLSHITVADCERYIAEKHFAPGSMLPKIQAAMKFASSKPGRRAIITSLDKAVGRAQRQGRHRPSRE